MNPLDTKQLDRLRKSIEWSEKQLQYPRKKRIESIKQYVGSHYSEGGALRPVPVSMLKLAVDIYVRQLAARAPRVLITTKREDLKPVAANLELAINQIPDEISLSATLRRMVTEALFSIGVLKVGLHTVGKALGHEYGSTFADDLSIDDYFCDMSAKRSNQIQYEGNSYWLNYEEVMDSDWLSKDARDGLKSDEYTVIGPSGEDRAEGISSNSTAEVFKDRIWLRDVWLPGENLMVTYGVKSEKLLKTIEWDGPDHGPYYKLGYSDVPGNLLPLAPVSVWRDLHELGNAIFRKLGNQADSQKAVLGFQGGDNESVEDFKKAKDGDGIRYTGAQPLELHAGGVDAKTLAFYLQCRDLYSYFAGNLDALGGLAPMTQTVGQDKLLGEAAGAQLRDMAAKTVEVVREVFQALCYYEWNDPIKQRTLEKPVPEAGVSIPVEWNRENKKGDISDYGLTIDVYSLQDDSPGLKLQKLGAITQQYILPLAPLIQQSGGRIDVQKILSIVAKYSDMPEINEIVTFVDQASQQESPPASESQAQPPQGQQEQPQPQQPGGQGMTPQGASSAMQQLLLGANPSGSDVQGAMG